MSWRTTRTIAGLIGATVLVAGLVVGARWVLRPERPVEYPADPTDQPPVFAAVDLSTLAVPGCPATAPDDPPALPGRPGDDKLVEWGAARFVRCTYLRDPVSAGPDLVSIDVIDDPARATEAVRVLRRMLTPAQFDAFFGPRDPTVRLAALFPSHRYLFQFPDGHVTEVDDQYGYYRDDIVRHRWSVRGSSLEPLQVPGTRRCGYPASPCHFDGPTVTVPD